MTRLALYALVLLPMAGALRAAEPAAPSRPATVGDTQNYRLASKHVDQVFSIDVYTPRAEGPLPVAYVLDGNGFFALFAQTVGPLYYAGEIPPLLVVGIGYQVDSPWDIVGLRVRDLTPSLDADFVARMRARGMPLPESVRPGGADAFLRFIEEELKPFIAARYPVKPDDQTLAGASFGGLFTLHTLFRRPEAFRRYIAGSPSIDWGDGELFRAEAALAQRVQDLPVSLFLSAGALETPEMVSNMQRMAERLEGRGYPGLALTRHVFRDETHNSVIGAAYSRGLRAVFSDGKGR